MGSSSGRRFYVQVNYNMFTCCEYLHHTCLHAVNILYHIYTYNRLPEDEPSGSKQLKVKQSQYRPGQAQRVPGG